MKDIRVKPVQRWSETNRQFDARQPAPYSASCPQWQATIASYLQQENFISMLTLYRTQFNI